MAPLTTSLRRTALAGMAVAAVSVAAPSGALASKSIDPSIYDSGVPAGIVEHGVVDFSITGSPRPEHTRTEYWVSSARWRSITTDAASGATLREAFGDAHSTHYLSVGGPADLRKIDLDAPAPPPMAGWTAAYNKKLVDRGLLKPVGPMTIAGIEGTDYTVPQDRKSTDPNAGDDKWVSDTTASQTEIVLENGTYKPLVRQTTLPDNGRYGTFVQREELVSREDAPATPQTLAGLTRKAMVKTLRSWKARVAKAAARHHAAKRVRPAKPRR